MRTRYIVALASAVIVIIGLKALLVSRTSEATPGTPVTETTTPQTVKDLPIQKIHDMSVVFSRED